MIEHQVAAKKAAWTILDYVTSNGADGEHELAEQSLEFLMDYSFLSYDIDVNSTVSCIANAKKKKVTDDDIRTIVRIMKRLIVT
jgi:hypothetical protein